jgi:hypothetical protein
MRKLYASVFSLLAMGSWLGAQAFAQTPAVMTGPANGSTLYLSSEVFQWTMGTGATDHWLYVGTAQGQQNVFGGEVGLATSQLVNGIPSGSIYVRLWTLIGSTWWFNDYIYTEAGGSGTPGVVTSPPDHSTLSASSVTFQWTLGPGATDHWLYVGTAQDQSNIFGGEVVTCSRKTLPIITRDF